MDAGSAGPGWAKVGLDPSWQRRGSMPGEHSPSGVGTSPCARQITGRLRETSLEPLRREPASPRLSILLVIVPVSCGEIVANSPNAKAKLASSVCRILSMRVSHFRPRHSRPPSD